MPDCSSKITNAFIKKCGHKPKAGLVKKWYLNWEDIDRSASTTDKDGTVVTNFVLKQNSKLYPAESSSKLNKAAHELVAGDFGNGYKFTDDYPVLYRGEDEAEQIQKLTKGAKVCSIVQKVDGGLNGEITYAVLGFESGMALTTDTWNSAENSGVSNLTIATKEGEEESTGAKILNLGTLAETEEWIAQNEYTPANG